MGKRVTQLLIIAAFVSLVGLGVVAYLQPQTPPASQAFINGQVITMSAANNLSNAVYIENERIVAVGTDAEIKALINTETIIHDLQGKTLLPGFIDAHGHFPGSAMPLFLTDLNSPPVGTMRSVTDILAQLKNKAAQTPKDEWVSGYGYDNLMLDERRHPNRDELDQAIPDHPVFIMHVSGHMGVANSAALALAGITESTEDPKGGHIERDASGRLTGLLEESAALELQKITFDLGITDLFDMVSHASTEYLKAGVTTAQASNLDNAFASGLKLTKALNITPLRLALSPHYKEFDLDITAGPGPLMKDNTDTLTIGAIKLVADGSIQGFTGYLSHPYHTPFKGDNNYRGYPHMPFEELAEWVERIHAAGFQMAIHGNGDQAIDDIINAFELAQKKHPKKDPRLILIHAQMAREDQLERMLALGITPSFFAAHTYYWGDQHRDVSIGPQRAFNISPAKTAIEKGLRFSTHLDTPVVPMSPLLSVWSTVNRVSYGGHIIGAAQRIDVIDGLRSVTIDAAWQMFKEKDLGSVEAGKLADLVVLEENPLEHPETIKDIAIEMTMIGGLIVYQRTP